MLQVQPSILESSNTPTAYSPPPPADATPENPPGEVPDPPPVHPDSDAEDGVNVDVDVKAPRGNFFVRLTLQVRLILSGDMPLLYSNAQHADLAREAPNAERLQWGHCIALLLSASMSLACI